MCRVRSSSSRRDSRQAAILTVLVPDLFAGRTFTTLDEGMAHSRAVGFDVLAERGREVADGYPPNVVYAGISLGVMIAQELAQTRPGARGAVLLCACLPTSEFGEAWPDGVPVQVHGKEDDPFFDEDLEAARALAASTDMAEHWLYPGDEHLFLDASLPAYDPSATKLLTQRVLSFLERTGSDTP